MLGKAVSEQKAIGSHFPCSGVSPTEDAVRSLVLLHGGGVCMVKRKNAKSNLLSVLN